MKIIVKKYLPEEWKVLSENAHFSVFNKSLSAEIERVDFALLMVDEESNDLISYATAQKVDEDTVYLQYGGAFPKFRGTPIIFSSFRAMLEELKLIFKKITTIVENTNHAMLKFYMKELFLITGIRYYRDGTFLENSYESAG